MLVILLSLQVKEDEDSLSDFIVDESEEEEYSGRQVKTNS